MRGDMAIESAFAVNDSLKIARPRLSPEFLKIGLDDAPDHAMSHAEELLDPRK
jgi:hypothetical protein